jgi:hypothetical protein
MPTRTQVVTAFGLMRVGIGAAMFVAPRALGRNDEVLITRSFAVRELVIGVRNRVPFAGATLAMAAAGLAFEAYAAASSTDR